MSAAEPLPQASLSATLFETVDAKTRRLTEFGLALGGFAIGTGEFSIMGLLPNVSSDLGVSIPEAGGLVSAYAVGVTVGAPILAIACARVPRRQLLLWLMGTYVIGNLLSAWSPDFGWAWGLRFLTGFPHGAFFGVSALLAAEMAGPGQRAVAVGRVMLGLTVATIVGTPLATALGQHGSWRMAYVLVSALALGSFAIVFTFAPQTPVQGSPSPLRELGGFAKSQVWLTLGIAAIGFGGLFSIYTYLNSTLTQLAGLDASKVPLVLSATGVGMVIGNVVGSRLADKSLRNTIAGTLVWSMVTCALFSLVAHDAVLAAVAMVLVGCGFALGPALQTRLMDVAGDAQTLAASANHSAFNVANALGAYLGGLAVSGGYGWPSTGLVGVAMAMGGFVLFAISWWRDRATFR